MSGYLAARELTNDERTAEEVEGLLRLLGLRTGDRLLDVPCGYGRHSVGLGRRGLQVVGCDVNRYFLDAAAAQAKLAGVEADFVQQDMRRLEYREQFDAVINMCYSFGFFESDQENLEVLRRFYLALKPGGRFVMHTDVNMSRVRAGKYKFDERRQLETGGSLRVVDNYEPQSRRMNGAWIISDGDGLPVRKDYSVRVYEKDEFVGMCLEVGFRECLAYASWAGDAWSEDAEEIMFVAIK